MLTAYVFPGQGSQFPGMGKELYEKSSSVREIYARARKIAGFDIAELSFEGDKQTLSQTQYTQPCIFVHSFAVLTYLGSKAHYDAVAGHSLGEYSALVAASVLKFDDAISAVVERGKLMAAAKEGSLIAPLGAELDTVLEVVNKLKHEGIIEVANYNAPGQYIVSGETDMLKKAETLLKERGVKKVIPLPVSGAFHSPLMEDARVEMEKLLAKLSFSPPNVKFYCNVTGEQVDNPENIRQYLVQQLTSPVRWMDIVDNMVRDGCNKFVEIGPGKVLRGLIKRITKNAEIAGWNEIAV